MNNILHHIDIDKYEPFEWQLNDPQGRIFEREIFQIINKQLVDKFVTGVRINQTSEGPDGGKDIVIQSPMSLCILNQNFDLGDKSDITIYIECKSSDKKRIDLSKIAGTSMRVRQRKIDYFMLVSNSTFTPQTLFLLKADFKTAGIKLKVVDQHILLKAIGDKTILSNAPKILDSKLYYEYQVSATRVDNKNAYEIFFSYRNLGNEEQLIAQKLLTDNNWSIDEIERKFFVNSAEIYTNKATIVRDFADGIDDLIFSVENCGTNETQVKIEGIGTRPIFEPPFFGTNHKRCESFLISRFKKTIDFDLCCIWGEAGIGKTRVFNEVFKKLDGQGFDFFSVPVRNNNKFLKDIKKFLVSKNYLIKNDKNETLNNMLLSSKNEFMRAIIMIDDCHNISDNTLSELKSLSGTNIPITIVLCGRTDYSVGTTDYYNFVQFTENNNNVGTWQLSSFSDEDTRCFIRQIIVRIPEVALDKICKMSNNNPLFIIHFIEYLLELNIVEINNRSSVGVTNINSFNSRLYIPLGVEGIYKKRMEYLEQNEVDADSLLRYFYILSILQDRQTKEIALTCLEEERLNFLIKRRFLNFSENGEIIFSHESFALYIRKKLESTAILKKNLASDFFSKLSYLLEYITVYERGVLAHWAGKKELSKEYFTNIIKYVKQTTNHSALNVDYKTNKYLTHIMELFAKDVNNKDFLIKVIKTKIYTYIHHFSPVIAISECNENLKFLDKNNMLKNDKRLNNFVKQQKAHAMIIAGQLCDAELLMQELLSDWLAHKNTLDQDTYFDLLDRFCGIYVDFNCKELAINFNEMSRKEKAAEDNRLMALVYLNKAKIHFLSDFELASKSLLKVQDLLKNGESTRILCSSKISYLMLELLYKKRCDYSNMIKESHLILEEAFDGNYAHSISRIYLILAVLHLVAERNSTNLKETKNLIDIGINYSTKFGFQRVLWKFYNLLAIVQSRLDTDSEEIRQTFATTFTLLQKYDYLNLGMRDLCTDNILILSNIGFFYQSKKTEKEFYEYMSKVTFFNSNEYQGKSDKPFPTKFLKMEYSKAKQKLLLFTHSPNNNLLRDSITRYFIAMS
ncbi:MAG: AAA family ATPase [Treponema sp.]|nr:AAA family ATPase [Treponema sp.]